MTLMEDGVVSIRFVTYLCSDYQKGKEEMSEKIVTEHA